MLKGVPSLVESLLSSEAPDHVEIGRGELWVLSWDGHYRGLVCVASIKSDFVLAWPVTLPEEAAYPPALRVAASPIGAANIWPTMEIGMGMHLLHRSLGQMLSPLQIRTISHAFDDGGVPPLPFAQSELDVAARAEFDQQRVALWTGLCFHEASVESEKYLSNKAIRARGVSAREIASALGLEPGEMRLLLEGRCAVSDSQLEIIARLAGCAPSELLEADPLAVVISMMSHPRHKLGIVEAMQASGNEARVRSLVRAQLPAVARGDKGEIDDGRIHDAILRVKHVEP